MGPVSAFIRRMTRNHPIALALGGAAALAIVLALAMALNRGGDSAPAAAEDLDAQTSPASGAPPEDGGQADIIPPDEGGDDQGAADSPDMNNTDVPAPQP